MAVAKLRQLLVADESSFAENAESGTPTYSVNIPCLDVDFSGLTQERIPDGAYQSRVAKRGIPHIGARGGQITFTTYWSGHQTAPTGAITETYLQQLLGDALGGNDVSMVGTTISGAGSTMSGTPTLDVVSATGMPAGRILRVGAKGDAAGNGQAALISSVDTGQTPDEVYIGPVLDAAPANGAIVYATALSYWDEDATQITKRFCMLHAGTGEQIHAFGCQLAGLSFELPFGQSGLPTITFTYNVAYWRRLTRSFPDATALASDATAPIAGGSVVLTDSGSTARTLVNPARMAINIELGLQPIPSSSTNGTYQQIGGWARTDFQATLEMDLPWVDTYETWWDTANQSITAKALIATLNPIAGLSVGFFCPRLLPMGQRPSVPTNVNDQTYVTVRFLCDEGPDPTSDLTKSSIRFFAG